MNTRMLICFAFLCFALFFFALLCFALLWHYVLGFGVCASKSHNCLIIVSKCNTQCFRAVALSHCWRWSSLPDQAPALKQWVLHYETKWNTYAHCFRAIASSHCWNWSSFPDQALALKQWVLHYETKLRQIWDVGRFQAKFHNWSNYEP